VSSITSAYFDYKTAEKGEPVIVSAPLQKYSRKFLDRAATETGVLKKPCVHNEPLSENCSAIGQMLIDYGVLRDKIRALTGKK
jgi:hypothetical protein